MSPRRLASPVSTLLLTVLVPVCSASGSAAAEPQARTAHGHPDLQGVWDFRTLTPLERPQRFGDQAVLSEEEAAEIEARSAEQAARADEPSPADRAPQPVGGSVGSYNSFWFDQGAKVIDDRRTSLIVDPPDGRIPLRPDVEVQTMGAADGGRPVRLRVGGLGTDGPEDRGLSERCLLGFNAGPPITPGGYNQNIKIFQTATHVVILNEMNHDARIVPIEGPIEGPIDRRPRLPPDIRHWMGESRGRWEGDTLIVETMHFTAKTASFSPTVFSAVGSGENLRLTERFRLADEDTLLYEFTVEDPTTLTRPFTAVLNMAKSDLRLFEYACHEANYGLRNILTGARAEERATLTAAEE